MYVNSNWIDAKKTVKENVRGGRGEVEEREGDAQIPSQTLKIY